MHKSNLKKTLATTIVASILSATSFANAAQIAPLKIDSFSETNQANGFVEISGYHWVKPHFRSNGSFVNGYMRSNPDGYCWNNLSGC